MPRRLSRRSLALYVANNLTPAKRQVTIKQLAGYLIESRRTKELTLIVRDVQYFLAEKGMIGATVTSAFDLSAETKQAIKSFITKKTDARSVTLDSLIDPAVIGGVKISLPGAELDQTVARQLTILKTRFKKA